MNSPTDRQAERQARRMREMIERLNVDTLRLARLREGDAHTEAHATCLSCRNTVACLQWLDASAQNAEPPTFCPNYPLFGQLKR